MTEKTPSSNPQPKRSAWYLLTGLILGLMIGVVFAWLVIPVRYEYTDPSSLKDSYKDVYRLTIAQVYAVTGDLNRANDRLGVLGDEDEAYILGAQAQRALANGQSEDAQALALLASALQSGSTAPSSAPFTTPTSTVNSVPTQTLPALTPLP